MADIATKLQIALSDIHTTTDSSLSALPDHEAILPPANGITLLDTKNEIFLSYLQALALRNLSIVRDARDLMSKSRRGSTKVVQSKNTRDSIVADLVRHRVYLDKGIRPLEDRLKYQMDKVLKAVDDQRQQAAMHGASNGKAKNSLKAADGSDDSGAEDSVAEADGFSFRPNPAALSKPVQDEDSQSRRDKPSSGAYKPPRINATMMPTQARKDKDEPKQKRNATMDEYINDELSSAPLAQPSVGTTIMDRGRRSKTAKDQQEEDERREYEEMNLIRLPKESKKDRGIKRREAEAQLGGEDLRGLGGAADRIGRLTMSASRGQGALEKSRKRKETADGPRGDGHQAGGAFEQRRKKVMRRLR